MRSADQRGGISCFKLNIITGVEIIHETQESDLRRYHELDRDHFEDIQGRNRNSLG